MVGEIVDYGKYTTDYLSIIARRQATHYLSRGGRQPPDDIQTLKNVFASTDGLTSRL